MKALIKITDPDKVELSLTLTMTLEAWKGLKEELSDKWPAWQFGTVITDMIIKAHAQFTSQDEIVK